MQPSIVFAIIFLAAGCAFAAADEPRVLPTVPTVSCENNIYRYILAAPPQTELTIQPTWDICPTLSGSLSCCDADYISYATTQIAELRTRTQIIRNMIESINNLNTAIQVDLQNGLIDTALKIANWIGIKDSLISAIGPEINSYPRPCGEALSTGMLDFSGKYPDCISSVMMEIIYDVLSEKPTRMALIALLQGLSDDYAKWNLTVESIMGSMDDYIVGVACGGCQPGYYARNAIKGFASVSVSSDSVVQLKQAMASMESILMDFLKDAINNIVKMADYAANSVGYDNRGPATKGDLRELLDKVLTLLDIPTHEIWELVSQVVSQIPDILAMFIGPGFGPIFEAYGIDLKLSEDMLQWSRTCGQDSLYSIVGLITQKPISLFPAGVLEAAINFLGAFSADVRAFRGSSTAYCYNGHPFALWLLQKILGPLMDENTPSPTFTLPWLDAEMQARLDSSFGRINQRAHAVAAAIPIWSATTPSSFVFPMTKIIAGNYPHPFRVFDTRWLAGYGLLDPDEDAYVPKTEQSSADSGAVLEPWVVAPPKEPDPADTSTNPYLLFGLAGLIAGIGAIIGVSAGGKAGWFGLTAMVEAKAAAKAAAEDLELEEPSYYEYAYEYELVQEDEEQ